MIVQSRYIIIFAKILSLFFLLFLFSFPAVSSSGMFVKMELREFHLMPRETGAPAMTGGGRKSD